MTALGATPQLMAHYPINLPTDYDMGIIRERVRTRGSALDDREGLVMKAYCVREAGVDGATGNQYAPFYLWADTAAAGQFHWGGTGFSGIVRDFGRPAVLTWLPVAVTTGGASKAEVTHARLRTWSIPRAADLEQAAGELIAKVKSNHGDPDVQLAVAGINPTSWEIAEFRTGTGPDAFPDDNSNDTVPNRTAGDAVLFTVLHVSQPEL